MFEDEKLERSYVPEYYECETCHDVQVVHRNWWQLREAHHIKHMKCPVCKILTEHRKISEKDAAA